MTVKVGLEFFIPELFDVDNQKRIEYEDECRRIIGQTLEASELQRKIQHAIMDTYIEYRGKKS